MNDGLKKDVLFLTAISGEISKTALLTIEKDPKKLQTAINALCNDGFTKTIKRDDMYGIRLSAHGKKYMRALLPQKCASLGAGCGIDKIRYGPENRLRSHKVSEVITFLYSVGVDVFDEGKNSIKFYSSYDIKDFGKPDESTRIRGSRLAGMTLDDTGKALLFYNTGDKPLKWEIVTEERTRKFIKDNVPGVKSISSVMIGNNQETAFALLKSSGGYQSRFYRVTDKEPDMFFVPRNEQGRMLLQSCFFSDKIISLKEFIKDKQQIGNTGQTSTLRCDGFVQSTAYLIAFDFDLRKIKEFKVGAEARGFKKKIICFDFQKKSLQAFFDNEEIVTVGASQAAHAMNLNYLTEETEGG